MKQFIVYSLTLLFAIMLNGCVKNEDQVYTNQLAEIDATTWNANSAGVTYPILTRRLPENRPVSTSVDSTLRRLSTSTRIRINLVGPQSAKDETVGYKVFTSPITSIAFPATI